MTKFSLFVAAALAALALATTPPAAAKGPGWKGAGGNPPGFSKGRKLGWGSAGHPPGWSHGRRNGWQGDRVPPGWSRMPSGANNRAPGRSRSGR